MKILIIDNNDSFTNNLEHLMAKNIPSAHLQVVAYQQALGGAEDVYPFAEYDLLLISPGPGCPADYPGYAAVIESGRPVLGVCLGMQIINEYFGGSTDRLQGCCHGRTDSIQFGGRKINVARYHSLYCSSVGGGLEVITANGDGVPMAVCHSSRALLGYQFHPESFLTEDAGVFIQYALDFFKIS